MSWWELYRKVVNYAFSLIPLKHHVINPISELTYAFLTNSSGKNKEFKYRRSKVQSTDKFPPSAKKHVLRIHHMHSTTINAWIKKYE